MSDTTLNRFLGSGTTTERLAFVPAPPTPAAGPHPGYTFWDTTLQALYAWNVGTSAWVPSTATPAAVTPGSPATSVQFNDSGAFGGDSGLLYLKATHELQVGQLDVGGAAASHALATFNGQYTSPLVSHVSPGATLTVNFAAGNEHYVSLNVDCAVTFSNAADGGRYIVYVVSNGFTVTWDSRVRWAGGTAPTFTAGGKLDLTTFGYVPSVDRFIGAFNLNYDLS